MEIQAPLPDALEDDLEVFQMFGEERRLDDDIINVTMSERKPRQHSVYQPL